jgi:hypothetical protein
MTSGPSTHTTTLEESEAEGANCAVCPHPWGNHDAIAARFCAATVVGRYSRGCVCVGDAGAPAN